MLLLILLNMLWRIILLYYIIMHYVIMRSRSCPPFGFGDGARWRETTLQGSSCLFVCLFQCWTTNPQYFASSQCRRLLFSVLGRAEVTWRRVEQCRACLTSSMLWGRRLLPWQSWQHCQYRSITHECCGYYASTVIYDGGCWSFPACFDVVLFINDIIIIVNIYICMYIHMCIYIYIYICIYIDMITIMNQLIVSVSIVVIVVIVAWSSYTIIFNYYCYSY